MTRPDFEKHNAEDGRLIILKHLGEQPNYSASETLLDEVLSAFGHNRSRDWIRTQIRKLAEVGGVTVVEVGTVLVATITRAGLDHVLRRGALEGVRRPSPTL